MSAIPGSSVCSVVLARSFTPAADETPAYQLLFCWFAVYLLFFSLSATKLPNYVLPLYPAAALATAFVPVLFSYGGWQQTNFIAEELVAPERNLPRAPWPSARFWR